MAQEWINIAGGLLFFGVGLTFLGHAMMLRIKGKKITAKVVAIREFPGSDGPTFKPEFEFICENNVKTDHLHGKRVTSDVSGSPPTHSVGDHVTVFYLEEANRIIGTKEWGWNSAIGIVVALAGLLHYSTWYLN